MTLSSVGPVAAYAEADAMAERDALKLKKELGDLLGTVAR